MTGLFFRKLCQSKPCNIFLCNSSLYSLFLYKNSVLVINLSVLSDEWIRNPVIFFCFPSLLSSIWIQSLNPVLPLKGSSTLSLPAPRGGISWGSISFHLHSQRTSGPKQPSHLPLQFIIKLWPEHSSCGCHITLLGSITYYFCAHTAPFYLASFLSFALFFPSLSAVFPVFITFLDLLVPHPLIFSCRLLPQWKIGSFKCELSTYPHTSYLCLCSSFQKCHHFSFLFLPIPFRTLLSLWTWLNLSFWLVGCFLFVCFCLSFLSVFFFLGLHLWHIEVPMPG